MEFRGAIFFFRDDECSREDRVEGERRRKVVLLIPVVNSLNRALGTLSCLFINYVIAKGRMEKGLKQRGGKGGLLFLSFRRGKVR